MPLPSSWTVAEQVYVREVMDAQSVSAQYTAMAAAIAACISSFSVIITGYVFYKELVKSKLYMKIIMMIQVTDFCATFVMTWGYPKNNTLCEVQAFLQCFFFRASWMWVTMGSLITYAQIKFGKMPYYLKFRFQNIYIWSINIVLQLIPYALGNSYGGCANGESFGHLNWLGRDPKVDVYVTFFLVLFGSITICTLLPLYMLCFTLPSQWLSRNGRVYKRIRSLVIHMTLYPACLVTTWGPNSFYCFIRSMTTDYDTQSTEQFITSFKVTLYTGAWCYLMAVAATFIFFYHCGEARAKWVGWFYGTSDRDVSGGGASRSSNTNRDTNDARNKSITKANKSQFSNYDSQGSMDIINVDMISENDEDIDEEYRDFLEDDMYDEWMCDSVAASARTSTSTSTKTTIEATMPGVGTVVQNPVQSQPQSRMSASDSHSDL